MEQKTKIHDAILKRQESNLPIVNLSYADFTFYDSLLSRRKIQHAFINIFKYPYYYPTAKGEQETLDAISSYYKHAQREVDPESLLLTSTINQSLLYLFKVFSAGNGEILIPTPCSPSMDEVASFLNIDLHTFPLSPETDWQINIEELEKSITTKTKAIFLMSPHMPTGTVQNEETIKKLLRIIKGKGIALVIDESLSDFLYNDTAMPRIHEYADSKQIIVYLHTLSNTFALPGFKLSWIQINGPKERSAKLLQSLELLADSFLDINQLSQTILPEVIKYSKGWRKKFQKAVEKNRDILTGKLAKSARLRFHYPEGGFYAFIELIPPEKKDNSDEFLEKTFKNDEEFVVSLLEETGIYVHPGYYYGNKKGNYFMVCFLQSPKVLRTSLKKIVRFLKPQKIAA